jgi:hypothetical protein
MRNRHHFVIVTLLLLVACRGNSDEAPREEEVPMRVARNAGTGRAAELAPGDIRIVNADSGVDLALIGDTISGGLSEKALEKARKETDTAAVKGTGFGAEIERMVKGTVQSALTTRVAFPLSSVRDVRYEGKRIVFEWNGKPRQFGTMKSDGKDILETFNEADAQRFVEAVRARKQAITAQ